MGVVGWRGAVMTARDLSPVGASDGAPAGGVCEHRTQPDRYREHARDDGDGRSGRERVVGSFVIVVS